MVISDMVFQILQEKLGLKEGQFPNAEFLSERTLSLPLSQKLTNGEVDDVITAVREVLGN